MKFKLLRTFQVYFLLKILMHISGLSCVSKKFQNTSMCRSIENRVQSLYREAVAQRCSVKKVFLEISQNSQENNCARVSFLIKLQA